MSGRKLGFWESGMALLHDKAEGAGIIFSAAHVRGKLDRWLIQEALDLMFQKHPLLRATLHATSSGYFFNLGARFASIPLHFINRESAVHWEHVGEMEMNRLFPTHEYLWRATILSSTNGEENEILLSFHHAIMDGFSCVTFVDDLLRAYVELVMRTFIKVNSLPLLPPIEEQILCHPEEASIRQEVKAISEKAATSLPYYKEAPIGKRVTKSLTLIFEEEILEKIRVQCHSRALNVNSLLYAALLLAQAELHGSKFEPFVISPVNLRGFCSPAIGDENVGCLISYICDQIEVKDSLWQLAKRYQESLGKLISKTAFLPKNFNLNSLGEYAQFLELKERKGFLASCCLTNKGLFHFAEIYGPLKLEKFFITSSRQEGEIMVNLSVTSILNKMFLCFSYAHPLVETSYVEALRERFYRQIVQLSLD